MSTSDVSEQKQETPLIARNVTESHKEKASDKIDDNLTALSEYASRVFGKNIKNESIRKAFQQMTKDDQERILRISNSEILRRML